MRRLRAFVVGTRETRIGSVYFHSVSSFYNYLHRILYDHMNYFIGPCMFSSTAKWLFYSKKQAIMCSKLMISVQLRKACSWNNRQQMSSWLMAVACDRWFSVSGTVYLTTLRQPCFFTFLSFLYRFQTRLNVTMLAYWLWSIQLT